MAEVDAELRVAAVEPLQTEVHILDRRLAQRQAEVAFLGFVGVADTIDDLLDVHLPAGVSRR